MTGWERAFVAMSAALGEPHEAACRALGDEGTVRAGALVAGLRSEQRRERVRVLAEALAEVARGLGTMDLRWR